MATKTTTTPSRKTSKSTKPAPAKAPKAKAAKSAAAKPDAQAPAAPEAAKAEVTKATKAPKAKREPKPREAKKPSGLDLAAKVLAEANEPLSAKTIAERVIAAGWKTGGATPHATLYAAMGREISKKGKDARFRKTGRGLFTAATSAPTTPTNGKEA